MHWPSDADYCSRGSDVGPLKVRNGLIIFLVEYVGVGNERVIVGDSF